MNAGEKTTKGSAIGVYALVAALLLMSYGLSIGPVIGLAERGYIGPGAIPYLRRFYAPLQFVQDHNGTAARMFDWYCGFFVPEQQPRR